MEAGLKYGPWGLSLAVKLAVNDNALACVSKIGIVISELEELNTNTSHRKQWGLLGVQRLLRLKGKGNETNIYPSYIPNGWGNNLK